MTRFPAAAPASEAQPTTASPGALGPVAAVPGLTERHRPPSKMPEFRASPKGQAQQAASWARRQAKKFGAPDARPHWTFFLRLRGLPCDYCGITPASGTDHVIPLARGGANAEANLVPACRACNRAKLFHTPEEWRAGTVVRMRSYGDPTACGRGHVRAEYGRRNARGYWECQECKRVTRRIRDGRVAA